MSAIVLPQGLAEMLKREAEYADVPLDAYVLDVLSSSLDPAESGRAYVEAAYFLLAQVRDGLARGDLKQAAEMAWGAAALAIKAYAVVKEGKRLGSQSWEYVRTLSEYVHAMMKELGDWVYDAWTHAISAHSCTREGWCGEEDVRRAIKRVRELVDAVAALILRQPK